MKLTMGSRERIDEPRGNGALEAVQAYFGRYKTLDEDKIEHFLIYLGVCGYHIVPLAEGPGVAGTVAQ